MSAGQPATTTMADDATATSLETTRTKLKELELNEKQSAAIGEKPVDPLQLPQLIKDVCSGVPETVLKATIGLRKLTNLNRWNVLQQIIECGLVPRLIGLLSWHKYPEILMEAAWCLTNVSALCSYSHFLLGCY
jgi:hypothetical protein